MGERQPKRRVRVHAGANRVGLLGEEIQITSDDHVGERPQVGSPHFPVRVIPAVKLLGQLEKPRPTVGPLERLAVLAGEVVGFEPSGFRPSGERRSTARISARSFRSGNSAEQPHEHPVAVHRRVPVVRAVKRRMERLRAPSRRPAREDMLGLVGIFLAEPLESQPGERRRLLPVQGR